MENKNQNKSVSEEKRAANRANAQRSTGPVSEEGKKKSAQNARRHGFFAKRLFRTREQEQTEEGAEYELILNGVHDHYRPVGFMEDYWAGKIATEMLRSLRVVGYEGDVLGSPLHFGSPFDSSSVDRVLRHQASISRQLSQAIEEIERLQEKRKAGANRDPDPPSDPGASPSAEQDQTDGQQANENRSDDTRDPSSSRNYGTNPTPSQPLCNEDEPHEQVNSEAGTDLSKLDDVTK
jgi:hypothetical protein